MLLPIATLLTIEIIGIAAFPIVARAFPGLADRGWAVAKPIGMLLIATVVWLASHTRLISNEPLTWWLVTVVLAIVSLRILFKDWHTLKRAIRRRWRFIVASEILFLTFFVLFLTLRAFDPAAAGTEKPMDLMMLNAVTSAKYAPPQDLWLAGHPVVYYYFGYWIYGGVASMGGADPEHAYNIGIALVGGLASAVVISLVSTLIMRDGARTKIALIAGGLSAFMLLLMSNLSGLWTLLDVTRLAPVNILNWYHGYEYERINRVITWRPDDFWWWWRSSRITNSFDDNGNGLDYTIQEFPFFSFLLGDFHPHLMSIPFVLTGITVLLGMYFSTNSHSISGLKKNVYGTIIIALVVGSSGFINFWDVGLLLLISFGLVVIAWLSTRQLSFKNLIYTASPTILIWLIGITVYSPFYFGTAESQVQWPPIAPVKYGTRPIHFLSIWLPLLLVVLPFILFLTQRYVAEIFSRISGTDKLLNPRRHLIWLPAWIMAAFVTAIPFIISVVTHLMFNEGAAQVDLIGRLPVTGVLGFVTSVLVAVTITRARRGADDGAQYSVVLTSISFYLLYIAELFFVHDLFGNRMNTVFKFYYQAWIVLSLVCGYGFFIWCKQHSNFSGRMKIVSNIAIVGVSLLMLTSVYHPVASAVTKTVNSGLGPTMSSIDFLEGHNRDELQIIREIQKIAEHEDILVEAVGGSYTEFGRISSASGVPTVIGWTFHQTQWHGSNDDFTTREEDVRTIYTSGDQAEVLRLVRKYDVTLAVVGPREKSTYGSRSMRIFDKLGERIIEHGKYTLYRFEK